MDSKFKALLDYLDDQLEGLQFRQVMTRLKEQESWQQAMARIRKVLAQPGIQEPPEDPASWPDENQLAAFLEGTLPPEESQQVEDLLEHDDRLLGQLATCHRVLTGLAPLGIARESYGKFYALGGNLAEPNWIPPTPREYRDPNDGSIFSQKPWEGAWQGKRVYAGIGMAVIFLALGMLWKGNTPVVKPNPGNQVALAPTRLEAPEKNTIGPVKETAKTAVFTTPAVMKKVEPAAISTAIEKKAVKKAEPPRRDPIPPAEIKTVVEIASLRPRKEEAPHLFFREQGNSWKFLSQGMAIPSNTKLLCLPFQQSTLEVSPQLWLGVEGWIHGSEKHSRPCQAEITLHPPKKGDLDLDFAGGRLILEASKKPARIILRQQGSQREKVGLTVLEVELELQPGSALVVESGEASSPGFGMALSQGKCKVFLQDQEIEMLSRTGLKWDTSGKRTRLGEKEAEIFLSAGRSWNIAALDVPGSANAAAQEMFLALKPGLDLGTTLADWVKSPRSNDARRWMGCQALAGLDQPGLLLDILLTSEGSLTMTRFSALEGLRSWYVWDKQRKSRLIGPEGNPGLLEREEWPQGMRQRWLDLIALNRTAPDNEGYEFLFELLLEEDRLLREMAHETLARLCASGPIPAFLKGADLKSRKVEVDQWREYLERGFLPGR